MSDIVQCRAMKANGQPCDSLRHLVRENGYCPAHDPENPRQIREAQRLGGEATAAKNRSAPYTLEELPTIETIPDAKRALDEVRRAVMTRRLTHAEGNAASKAVAEWVKAEQARLGDILGELQAELDQKTQEIDALRKQIASQSAGRPHLARVAQ